MVTADGSKEGLAWPTCGTGTTPEEQAVGLLSKLVSTLSPGLGWRRAGGIQPLTLCTLSTGFPFFISLLTLALHPLRTVFVASP